MKTNVFNSADNETVKIELEMTNEEFKELVEENSKMLALNEAEDQDNVIDELEALGLRKKNYRIICHANPQVTWVEKAYSQVLVIPIAIAGCQLKTGSPAHSITRA